MQVQPSDNRYIIVSGNSRTGTSLMMQTLKALGLKVSGEKFVRKPGDELYEEHYENNPLGFYEIPYLVNVGIKDYTVDKINGEVVKLNLPGLLKTDKKYVDKLIYCIRNPQEMVDSKLKAIANDQSTYQSPDHIYYWHNRMTKLFIKNTPVKWWKEKILVVDYADMVQNNRHEINRICEFLTIEPRAVAFGVVQSGLYRSKPVVRKNKQAMQDYRWLRGKIGTTKN